LRPFAQGGDGLGADAVQPGGDLVGALVELGAGAHGGHDHFKGGALGLVMLFDGDAAAVVVDADAAVHVDLDVNVLAVTGHGLVHAVEGWCVGEVVQAAGRRVADVHGRPLADVGGVTEDLNVVLVVARGLGGDDGRGFCFGQDSGLVGHSYLVNGQRSVV